MKYLNLTPEQRRKALAEVKAIRRISDRLSRTKGELAGLEYLLVEVKKHIDSWEQISDANDPEPSACPVKVVRTETAVICGGEVEWIVEENGKVERISDAEHRRREKARRAQLGQKEGPVLGGRSFSSTQ